MNIKFYLFSFFIVFFNNYKIMYSIMPSNRNISILIDCGKESVNKSLNTSEIGKGLGAISTTFLDILNQEAGPILVTESLISNILGHRDIFNDFLSLDLSSVYQKYSKFTLFKDLEFTRKFSVICRYYNLLYNELSIIIKTNNSKSEILNKIYKDPVFDKSNAPQILQSDESLKTKIGHYLMCYKLSLERYIIKKLISPQKQINMYLFIPLSYIRSINPDYQHTKTNQIKPVDAPLDNIEKILGLKFNHYPDVDFEAVPDFVEKKVTCQKMVLNMLNNIFVSRNEAPNTFNVWSILIKGHGIYDQENIESAKKLQKEKENYEAKYIEKKIKIKNLLIQQKKEPKNVSIINEIILQNDILDQIKKYIKNEKKIIDQHYNQNTIAGLQGSQFAKMLKFFNDKIFTGFVFYSSCFAGGQHFVDPYKETTTGMPISLNYAIASDSLTETKSFSLTPIFPFYWDTKNYDQKIERFVDLKEKKIIFYSDFDFKAFFNALKQESKELLSFKKVLSNVSIFDKEFVKTGTLGLGTIPSIRFPGTAWFSVIDYDNYLIALTNVKILAQNNQPLKVNYGQKISKAILLYKDVIPFTLDIAKNNTMISFPSIVSMLPGKAKHIFENIYAPGYTFTEIIKAFYPFKDLGSSKLFFIKKITAINDLSLSESKEVSNFENVLFIVNGRISQDSELTNIINFQFGGDWYNFDWPRDYSVPSDIATSFKKILKKNIEEFLNYFNDVKEPGITGSFTGFVTTTLGQEKVSIKPVAKTLQNKLKLMQDPKLKEQFFKSKIFKPAIDKEISLKAELLDLSSSLNNLTSISKSFTSFYK